MAKKQSFEQAMETLENIVQELESGDLALEKAMHRFEEGIKLSKFCSDKLDETEKKISVLLHDNKGNIAEEPFMPENESKDD